MSLPVFLDDWWDGLKPPVGVQYGSTLPDTAVPPTLPSTSGDDGLAGSHWVGVPDPVNTSLRSPETTEPASPARPSMPCRSPA